MIKLKYKYIYILRLWSRIPKHLLHLKAVLKKSGNQPSITLLSSDYRQSHSNRKIKREMYDPREQRQEKPQQELNRHYLYSKLNC